MTTLPLDYRSMTDGERRAAEDALIELVGDYRDVPAYAELDHWPELDLVLVPMYTSPRRLLNGEVVKRDRLAKITDANRWALIFLLAVSARQQGWTSAPNPERPLRPERLCMDHSGASIGGPKDRCPVCLGTQQPVPTAPSPSPWTVPVDHEFVGNGPTCSQCTRPPSLHVGASDAGSRP